MKSRAVRAASSNPELNGVDWSSMKLLVTSALLFGGKPLADPRLQLFNVFTEDGQPLASDLTAAQVNDLAAQRGADVEYVPPPDS